MQPKPNKHKANDDLLAAWLSTRVLMNIAALKPDAMLRGQPDARRAAARRRFPRVEFYGDEIMSTGLPGHRHAHTEIATVLEGRLHLGIDDQLYEARAGDWLLFEPNVLHGECALPQRTHYALFWFIIRDDRFRCHVTRYTRTGGYELLATMTYHRLPGTLHDAVQHIATVPDQPMRATQRVLVRLVSWCMDALADRAKAETPAHPSVTEAARFVRDRLDRPPTVVELANHVGLSPNYLSSLFHQQTGQTLRTFMSQARIEQAQRLLDDPQRSVKQIAYQLGFADPHHFSRVFQRITGQTPSAYRRAGREDSDT